MLSSLYEVNGPGESGGSVAGSKTLLSSKAGSIRAGSSTGDLGSGSSSSGSGIVLAVSGGKVADGVVFVGVGDLCDDSAG